MQDDGFDRGVIAEFAKLGVDLVGRQDNSGDGDACVALAVEAETR